MSKHSSSGMRKALKQLKKLGIRLEYKSKGIMLIPSDKNIPAYMMHYGEKAIHPVRRWVKRHYGVDIKF